MRTLLQERSRPSTRNLSQRQAHGQQHGAIRALPGPGGAAVQLARAAPLSAPVTALGVLQRKAAGAVQQWKGGKKKGTFIGDASACHLHIDIAAPHFKLGNDMGSRMNFGSDYKQSRMQAAYEEIKAAYSGKPGYEACIEWLEAQGCS